MSSTDYQLYAASVQRLTDTLIIKSGIAATRQNLEVQESFGQPVGADPKTWKYYLNLAGLYHNTQVLMKVMSLDTLEEIDFTKENLLRHRMTAREYAYGGTSFTLLLDKYPLQRALILGILNPVDIDKAIAAREHEIIWYSSAEVNARETNLIPKLQQEIDDYFRAWEHEPYESVDMLHITALYGILFCNIPQFIKGIRWQNVHTPYAHDFHVWNYLASHQGLDRFKRFLLEEQTMWLYRNIEEIEHNMGKAETFATLIEHLLTWRGIPIGSFELLQDSDNIPEELKPAVFTRRTPLNMKNMVGNGQIDRPLLTLMQQQIPLAQDNGDVHTEAFEHTLDSMQMLDKNRLKTKTLESDVEDLTDSELYAKYDFQLNQWIYFSHMRMYNTVLTTTNPGTGNALRMSPRDAFKLFVYMLNRSMGIELIEVPKLQANHVRRVELPTFKRLRGITHEYFISDALIDWCLEDQPTIRAMISTEEFAVTVNNIYKGWRRHHQFYTLQEHYISRGMAEAIVENFYADVPVDLDEGQLYKDFFLAQDWELDKLTDEECGILAVDLFNKATGAELEDLANMKDIQYGMLQLLKTLSSYTIQIIQTINSDPIKPLEWPMIRFGSKKESKGEEVYGVYSTTKILQSFNQSVTWARWISAAGELHNWREEAHECNTAPAPAQFSDHSGYENTQVMRFSTQYFAPVEDRQLYERFRRNPLQGLWVEPFPGAQRRDLSERLPAVALAKVALKPLKDIALRFTTQNLSGFVLAPVYKSLESRFNVISRRQLFDPAYRPLSLRLANNAVTWSLKPLEDK